MTEVLKNDDVWECIQLLNGELFIFRNGYKEEASAKDIFKFDAGYTKTGQVIHQFSRFDFNPAKPSGDCPIRLNRAAITFSWFIDPSADIIRALKKAVIEMDAKKAGIIIPGPRV